MTDMLAMAGDRTAQEAEGGAERPEYCGVVDGMRITQQVGEKGLRSSEGKSISPN